MDPAGEECAVGQIPAPSGCTDEAGGEERGGGEKVRGEGLFPSVCETLKNNFLRQVGQTNPNEWNQPVFLMKLY